MISIQDLNYTMDGHPVLSGFSMEINPGKKILIRGRSGSGKTSLFRLLLGFAAPDAGSIHINGLPLDTAHIREIRNHVFYLSQDVDLPHETGSTLVARLERLNKERPLLMESRDDFLTLLDLPPTLLGKKISVLSGGERQRLGLLMGFLLNRPVWLLDEPTSALDDAMKKIVADYITAMDKTVLVVSHDRVWEEQPEIIKFDWR